MKYKDLINGEVPVLVDFSATWCGPCKAMEPILKEVSSKQGDQAKIIKIDIDRNRKLAEQLGIKSVPTFILYKKGEQVWRGSGMQSVKSLNDLIANTSQN